MNFFQSKGFKIGSLLFSVLCFIFILLKIQSYYVDQSTSFLVTVGLCVIFIYLAQFLKSGRALISSTMFTILLLEIALFCSSPYRSTNEKSGDMNFQSEFYGLPFDHFRTPDSTFIYKEIEFTTTIKSNSLGLRDTDTEKENIQILIMGDSFVEGYGIDQDFTLDVLLEKKLSCISCVLNLGRMGSDLVVAKEALDKVLNLNYKPSLVILNINNTDYFDLNRHFHFEGRPSYLFEFAYGSSFIFRHVSHLIYELDFLLLTPNEREVYNKAILEEIQPNLVDYQTILAQKDINFLVLLQPVQYEIENGKSDLEWLIPILEDAGINYYYALEDFKARNDLDSLYWPLDRHFTNAGNEVYSELIYQQLIKNKLTPTIH